MLDTVIASLSLLLSIGLAFFYVRDRRHARFTLEAQHAERLISWHEQVVAILVRAAHLKRDVQSSEHQLDLASLSTLIEQGRFLFPNIDKGDGYGSGKPPAYRGYRNLALDFLVSAHKLLSREDMEESLEDLELIQKHFTSIVIEIVSPRDNLESIRSLTNRYFVVNKSYEDFLENKDSSVLDHIWRDRR